MLKKPALTQAAHNSDGCRFCNFFSHDFVPDEINHPWLESKSYSAIVSVGALVEGWSLICPREHTLNLSYLYQKREFWQFVSDVVSELFDKFKIPVRLFEHGPANPGSLTGCGTDHAHLHAVPLSFSIEEAIGEYDSCLFWQECDSSKIAELTRGNEYLFYVSNLNENQASGQLAILDTRESQYFWRVLANKLGMLGEYDYKKYPQVDVVMRSIRMLHDCNHSALREALSA